MSSLPQSIFLLKLQVVFAEAATLAAHSTCHASSRCRCHKLAALNRKRNNTQRQDNKNPLFCLTSNVSPTWKSNKVLVVALYHRLQHGKLHLCPVGHLACWFWDIRNGSEVHGLILPQRFVKDVEDESGSCF